MKLNIYGELLFELAICKTFQSVVSRSRKSFYGCCLNSKWLLCCKGAHASSIAHIGTGIPLPLLPQLFHSPQESMVDHQISPQAFTAEGHPWQKRLPHFHRYGWTQKFKHGVGSPMLPSSCSFFVHCSGLILLQYNRRQAKNSACLKSISRLWKYGKTRSEAFFFGCCTSKISFARLSREQQLNGLMNCNRTEWIFFISWNGQNTNTCLWQKASIFCFDCSRLNFLNSRLQKDFLCGSQIFGSHLYYFTSVCINFPLSKSTKEHFNPKRGFVYIVTVDNIHQLMSF